MKYLTGLLIVSATLAFWILGTLVEGFLCGRHLATPAQMVERFPAQMGELFYGIANSIMGCLLLAIAILGWTAAKWIGAKLKEWMLSIKKRRHANRTMQGSGQPASKFTEDKVAASPRR